MSSIEIEDVLTSIRRLVSDDLRPAARPAPVVETPHDKLVLTPAFRIVTDEVAVKMMTPVDMAVAAPERPSPLPRLHLGTPPPMEKVAASLELAVAAHSGEWESEVGDAAPMAGEGEWLDTEWEATRIEATESDLVDDAKGQGLDGWAQDDSDEIVFAHPAVDTFRRPDAVSPDPVWAAQAEAEVVADLSDPVDEADAGLFADGPEMTFDESVLRDLVRDLIREELQGGLGERITRNVRKLVRAEIARALAAREFD